MFKGQNKERRNNKGLSSINISGVQCHLKVNVPENSCSCWCFCLRPKTWRSSVNQILCHFLNAPWWFSGIDVNVLNYIFIYLLFTSWEKAELLFFVPRIMLKLPLCFQSLLEKIKNNHVVLCKTVTCNIYSVWAIFNFYLRSFPSATINNFYTSLIFLVFNRWPASSCVDIPFICYTKFFLIHDVRRIIQLWLKC